MLRLTWVALVACASPPTYHYPLHPPAPVAASGQIEVIGAVNKPGTIEFHPGMTLTEALGEAGGISPIGYGTKLTRSEHGVRVTYVIALHRIISEHWPDPELAPGDQILVGMREL